MSTSSRPSSSASSVPALPSNRRVVSREEREGSKGNVRVARVARKDGTPEKPWDPELLWRRLRLVGRVVLAAAVLAAGVVAAVAARRYVTTSPRFGLKDLRIVGAKRHATEWVTETAGISLGQNVVDLDLDGARAKLERDPWIERATLARRLPSSLTIEIVEREAASMVSLPSGIFLATAQGQLFKRFEPGDPSDLPIVTGITEGDAGGDRDATAQLVKRALDLSSEIERVGLYGGRIEEVHVDADGGLSVVLGKRGVRVVFGRPPYRQKVRLGLRIEGELARRNARPTVIFLDDDTHAERIVVRLVSALPPAEVTIDDAPKDAPKNAGKDGKNGKPKALAKAAGKAGAKGVSP